MEIKKMSKEDLELLSYTDITYMLLQGKNKTKSTPELFKQIIDLLELSDQAYEDQIGDYYTSLTTDKRFIILENGKWDLKYNHSSEKFIIPIDDDEIEEADENEVEEEDIEEEVEFESTTDDDEDLVDDDEDVLEDLVIIDEETELE